MTVKGIIIVAFAVWILSYVITPLIVPPPDFSKAGIINQLILKKAVEKSLNIKL